MGVGDEGGGGGLLADLLSLSLPLFLTLSFPLTQIYVQEEHCWMINGPGRAGRRRQASIIAASHAPSLAVPCEEERIPRCGRRPAKLIKFTLGLQLVCRKQKKFAQSSPVGLHKEAKSLHLVCNWCAGSKKSLH